MERGLLETSLIWVTRSEKKAKERTEKVIIPHVFSRGQFPQETVCMCESSASAKQSKSEQMQGSTEGSVNGISCSFHSIIDILSKSTITLTFTVLTPSRDKRRYWITEKRYRAQNNGPTFVMEILQKMQKLALFCNWREIKSTSCRSRWDRESRLLPLVTFSFFGEFCLSVDNFCVLCFVPFPSIPSGKQRTSFTALLRKKFIGLSQTCWSWRTLTVFGAAFRKGFPRTWEQRKLIFAVLLLFQSKRPRQGILSERQQTNPWFKILNFPHLFPRKFISPWLSRLLRLNYNVLCAKGKVSLNDPKYGKVCVYVSVFLAKDILLTLLPLMRYTYLIEKDPSNNDVYTRHRIKKSFSRLSLLRVVIPGHLV